MEMFAKAPYAVRFNGDLIAAFLYFTDACEFAETKRHEGAVGVIRANDETCIWVPGSSGLSFQD